MKNGDLLATAESRGFEVLVTGDGNPQYQQNLTQRKIAIVVLTRNNWPIVKPHVVEIVAAVGQSTPGDFRTVDCSPPS